MEGIHSLESYRILTVLDELALPPIYTCRTESTFQHMRKWALTGLIGWW